MYIVQLCTAVSIHKSFKKDAKGTRKNCICSDFFSADPNGCNLNQILKKHFVKLDPDSATIIYFFLTELN